MPPFLGGHSLVRDWFHPLIVYRCETLPCRLTNQTGLGTRCIASTSHFSATSTTTHRKRRGCTVGIVALAEKECQTEIDREHHLHLPGKNTPILNRQQGHHILLFRCLLLFWREQASPPTCLSPWSPSACSRAPPGKSSCQRQTLPVINVTL